MAYALCGFAWQVALCEKLGKQSPTGLSAANFRILVYFHQHIFRTFLKPSPQSTSTGSRGNLRRIRKHSAQQLQKESAKRLREERPAFQSTARRTVAGYCNASISRVRSEEHTSE